MSAKPGRNDPCYCGSGKKYKRCHLPLDEKTRSTAATAAPPAPEMPAGPHQSFERATSRWTRRPRLPRNTRGLFKALSGLPLLKKDPELKRLLAYAEGQPAIEAAARKMEEHNEEFARLLRDPERLNRQSDELFGEDAFAEFRFTGADIQRAFEEVGYEPLQKYSDEEQMALYTRAVLFLASKELRERLGMELLMLLPRYVEEGRFMDAHQIAWASQSTAEDFDETNPFLQRMFWFGLEEWVNQQEASRLAILREFGIRPDQNMGPEELEDWITEQLADPAKARQLEQMMKAHPQWTMEPPGGWNTVYRDAVSLLDRDDASCLLLGQEELEAWAPFLAEKLATLAERYGPLDAAPQLSEAQQKEGVEQFILPAVREMAKGLFTRERIQKLVTDLKEYRKSLMSAGDRDAAFSATHAIHYVEPEDDPSQNVFLINLCVRSLFGMKPDLEEEGSDNDV